MRTIANAGTWCLAGTLLASCAAEAPRAPVPKAPTFSGKSYASQRLKMDSYEAASMLAMATANNCPTVDLVETSILDVSRDIVVTQSGRWLRGKVQELWTFVLCNQRLPYRITHTADGRGGTYVEVEPYKP